jgi:ferredoxin-thioredoxin reductase catalytic subunit
MDERLQKRLEKLKRDAAEGGYKLNPDEDFVADLTAGLLANQDRYGIESCPCRLFTGEKEDNMDIVCPCMYRDDDLAEYGACFCALYVTDQEQNKQVPERRPSLEERRAKAKTDEADTKAPAALPYPVYRCSVCGYLCANNNPPRVCPICKASSERFERFM